MAPARDVMLVLRPLATVPAWIALGSRRACLPALVRVTGGALMAGHLLGSPSDRASYVFACAAAAVLIVPQSIALLLGLAPKGQRWLRRLPRALAILAGEVVGLLVGIWARMHEAPQASRSAVIVGATWLFSIIIARWLERQGIDG